MKKAVIFDLDGTILNTLEDLADSMNWCLRRHGMPERSIQEVRMFVGNGIRKLVSRALPEGSSEELIDQVFQEYKEYYGAHCSIKTRPYEGIPELLVALKEAGILTAVVSNKADFAVKELCEKYFPGLFKEAVGEKEGIARKPAPDSVNAVLAAFGLSPKEAVYVGDSDVDVETAENADMDCIGVAWGFRGKDFLMEHGAALVADTVEQLQEQLFDSQTEGVDPS